MPRSALHAALEWSLLQLQAMATGTLATGPSFVPAGPLAVDRHSGRRTRASSSAVGAASVAAASLPAGCTGGAERFAVQPLLVAASICLSRNSAGRRRRMLAHLDGIGTQAASAHTRGGGTATAASLAACTAAAVPVLRAQAARPLAAWSRRGGSCRTTGNHDCAPDAAIAGRIRLAAAGTVAPAPAAEGTRARRLRSQALLAFTFLVSAAGNKILLRILLILAAPYTHLLGVLTNALYIVVFSSQLLWARRTGAPGVAASVRFVSSGLGFRCLATAGMSEAVAFVMVPLFASRLPGTLMPVMAQGILLFSMCFGVPLLGNRYSSQQVVGAAVVVAGVGICTFGVGLPSGGAWMSTSAVARHLLNVSGLFCAYAFIALAVTVKEMAFRHFRQEACQAGALADATPLRMEVVNFYTAFWQGLAMQLLWPVNFALVTQMGVGEYFAAGVAGLWQARHWVVVYLCVNLAYTVATTAVLQRLSAIALLLTNVLNVPLVSLLFCLELPLLGAAPFHYSLLVGLAVIVFGLITYNMSRSQKRLDA